jgi:5'-deoxynucleotidase YfbR-like HD superfamily hydrolase
MNIADVPKDCIRTNSGLYINIFDPSPEMICIEDIAHGLARQPRFAGHLNRHYSVAQHSIHCYERALPENKMVALLHDASEAYMLDMPTPIKARMPEYKEHEHHLMSVIAKKFGFVYPYNHPEIKEIDTLMVNLEWDMLVEKNDMSFKCLTAIQAKKEFLRVYYEICKCEQPEEA